MFAEKLRLDGRVAVVTGGGRGIGLSCAEALCEHGASVVIADVDLGVAEQGRDDLRAKGYAVEIHRFDVTRSAEVDGLAEAVLRQHGRVDILVANAGIARSGTPAEDVTDEHWNAVNDVNYNGVFWCDRAFARPMLKAGRGAIVNIGSMSGRIVNWPFRHAAYNVSKAAVHMLTKCLATEWAEHNIRVNAIAPGYIMTELTEEVLREHPDVVANHWAKGAVMNRIGSVDELVGAAVYLASDASSFTTGEVHTVDGGLTLR